MSLLFHSYGAESADILNTIHCVYIPVYCGIYVESNVKNLNSEWISAKNI